MIALIVKLLLSLVPGLGPFAPVIAAVALKLGALEAADAYAATKALVQQADADKSLTTGEARFAWVLPRAVEAFAKAQPGVALSLVRTTIELAVQEVTG